jgi:hypothetical protein
MTAKDDNEKKELVWGALTDAEGAMYMTLRDFRAHVPLLTAVGRPDLAIFIATDQLESYAAGLNQYVRDLYRIAAAHYKPRTLFARN